MKLIIYIYMCVCYETLKLYVYIYNYIYKLTTNHRFYGHCISVDVRWKHPAPLQMPKTPRLDKASDQCSMPWLYQLRTGLQLVMGTYHGEIFVKGSWEAIFRVTDEFYSSDFTSHKIHHGEVTLHHITIHHEGWYETLHHIKFITEK